MAISIPEHLHTGNAENYKMSIRLCSDGLSFSGYNPSESGSFFYGEATYDRSKSYIAWLKDLFFENDFFNYPFAAIHVLYLSSRYTLVPNVVLKDKEEEAFLSFTLSGSTQKGIRNAVRGEEMTVVFDMPEDIYEFCARSLLNPTFVHHLVPFLSVWKKRSAQSIPKHMYVYIHGADLDIICYDQGRLLFANSFPFQDTTDIIYFILYAWRQNGMDQKKDLLLLDAPKLLRSELQQILSSFIFKMESIGIPTEFYLLGSGTDRAPLDLLYLSICE